MDSDATFSGGDLIIYVANTVEGTAYDFVRQLPSAERHAVIRKDQLLGERALFWGGDNVLVLTSLPAKPSFCNYAKEVMGCDRLANDWPQEAGIALSAAVMADDCLMDRVSDLIKKATQPVIVPYAVTREFSELAGRLKASHPALQTPESCTAQTAPMIYEFDSKAGIRRLMAELGEELGGLCQMPEGYACATRGEAEVAFDRFFNRGVPFLVKPNLGESGMGILKVDPHGSDSGDRDACRLDGLLSDWPWKNDIVVIEEEIQHVAESPGVQIEVPARDCDQVRVTYICRQRLTLEGAFRGIELIPTDDSQTYDCIRTISLRIGAYLQRRGYAGRCGLDFIVDRTGAVFLIESNLRRGGGTHVHAIASRILGRDLHRMATVSRDNRPLPVPFPVDFDTLRRILKPYLSYSPASIPGIVLTACGSLQHQTFGYVAMGGSADQVADLESMIEQTLQRSLCGETPASRQFS
jgi:hypothetical protein